MPYGPDASDRITGDCRFRKLGQTPHGNAKNSAVLTTAEAINPHKTSELAGIARAR